MRNAILNYKQKSLPFGRSLWMNHQRNESRKSKHRKGERECTLCTWKNATHMIKSYVPLKPRQWHPFFLKNRTVSSTQLLNNWISFWLSCSEDQQCTVQVYLFIWFYCTVYDLITLGIYRIMYPCIVQRKLPKSHRNPLSRPHKYFNREEERTDILITKHSQEIQMWKEAYQLPEKGIEWRNPADNWPSYIFLECMVVHQSAQLCFYSASEVNPMSTRFK